jgi:hypothetical protein
MPRLIVEVALVMIFANGLCAVFDRNGRQIPRLQGDWSQMYGKVLRRCSDTTRFEDYRERG